MGNLRKCLGENLRRIRGKRSLTEFSRTLGISKSSLHRIEAGTHNTTVQILETLCKNLKITINVLFE